MQEMIKLNNGQIEFNAEDNENFMIQLDKLQEASWSPTVDVFINISYTKILDIDTINQRFQAEAIIESKWFDPNIKSINDPIDEKKIWKPDLYVENGIKDVKEEVVYRILQYRTGKREEPKLFICEMRKVTGIFYENLELQDFPLDVQDLTLHIASKKPGNIVRFVIMQEIQKSVKISSMLDKSMWQIKKGFLTQEDDIKREYSYCYRKYPGVKITVKLFRLPGFFYWNALLPILLVTLASLAPFVVDIKIPQSRLPSTCTLMLTSVSIRWTIGRLLPTVSYLTSLDKYSLGSMFIITMELLYHAIMGAIFPLLPQKFAYNLDKGFFIFFCVLIFFKQILLVYWIIRRYNFRKKFHNDNAVVVLNRQIFLSTVNISKPKFSFFKLKKNQQNVQVESNMLSNSN